MGGGLVVVLAWCDNFGDPSTIILYKAVSGGGVSDALVTVTRSGDAPDGRYAEISLDDPGAAWQADQVMPALDEAQAYEVRAWDDDQEHRVRSFPFTLSEVPAADATRPIFTKT